MSKRAYLGLDIGGTGAKAGVFDESGTLLGFGHASYTPSLSMSGHSEIPIEDIYSAARDSVGQAIRQSGEQVCALAVSSQGQTFVTLDRNDHPLHRAIMWYDSRACEQADALHSAILSAGTEEPVPLVEAIASAPKIIWFRQRHPGVVSHARRFLLLPDYFSYRLTGEAVTDPSTASSTGLYADDAPGYSRTALDASEIDLRQLARIEPSGAIIGRVLPAVADEWGLSHETMVVVGTNDQYAGAIGAGNCMEGILSETTGTCLALITLTMNPPDGVPAGIIYGRFPISTFRFALAYAKTAGLVVDWFRRLACPDNSLSEMEAMASRIPIGSNGVTVLPHFDGMVSPNPNPSAGGFIANLSLQHTAADIHRAILESLSFSLRENMELLRSNGLSFDVIRSIGGGAKSDLWLQMKADVTGLPVERPVVTEAATLGAAMLAAVGAGDYSCIEECSRSLYRVQRAFEPRPVRSREYEQPYGTYLQLCRKLYS